MLIPDIAGAANAMVGIAAAEAVLVALRSNPELPLTEDTYLDLIANLDGADIRYLQPEEAGINRFALSSTR
jgi:hypothetical protein